MLSYHGNNLSFVEIIEKALTPISIRASILYCFALYFFLYSSVLQ